MRIGPPRTRQERTDALACLLGAASGTERVREALALAEAEEIDLGGLFACWQGREVLASALFCLTPDGSAFVWPPEVRTPGTHREATDVLHTLVEKIDAVGCPYAQAAVEPDRPDHELTLREVGFDFLANLLFLQRPLDEPLPTQRPVESELLRFTEKLAGRFSAVIERSYAGSRDCPAFSGFRTAAEAFRSYRTAGTFTPARWCLVKHRSVDAGVILVNDRDGEPAREIVYLGIVPEFRRFGLARHLVSTSLLEARSAGIEVMITSVDASNLPAVNLYSRFGFFPTARRAIYVRRSP